MGSSISSIGYSNCPCLGRGPSTEDGSFVIIVPLRSSFEKLAHLRAHFDSRLPPSGRLLIVEQACDGHSFNRGQLLNIGYVACLQHLNLRPDIVIFQDPHMLPDQATLEVYAHRAETPVRIFGAEQGKYRSDGCFRGVIASSPDAFETVNGFPNNFWGLGGGENSALQARLKKAQIQFTHSFGMFEVLDGTQADDICASSASCNDPLMGGKEKRQRLATDKKRWKQDGLSTTELSIVKSSCLNHGASTWCLHLVVELASETLRCGRCLKWQPKSLFSNTQANQRGAAENTVCTTCLSDEQKEVEDNMKRNGDSVSRRTCQDCGMVFQSRSQLFKHVAVCQGESERQLEPEVCVPCAPHEGFGVPGPRVLSERARSCIEALASRLSKAQVQLHTGESCSIAKGSESLLRRLLASQKITAQSKYTNIAQLQSLLARVSDVVADLGEPAVLELGAGAALFTRAMYEVFDRKRPVIALDVIELTESRKPSIFDPLDVKPGEAPYTRIITDVTKPEWVEHRELQRPVVAVTKHLCAGATDAAIVQVCHLQLAGVCMAPCCHQKLCIGDYCNRPYLDELGFGSSEAFKELLNLIQISCHKELKEFEYRSSKLLQVFEFQEVKRLGQAARRILEEGRARYLRDRGFDVQVLRYVSDDITPDNLVIVARRSASAKIS